MELRVRTKCEVCGGSGVVYAPKCSVCDAHYDPADLENSAFWGKPRMPCGHLRSCLIEEWECYECQGTGEKEWWMGFDQMVLEILKRREGEWPDAFRTELAARKEKGGDARGSEVPLRETPWLQGAS